MKLFGYISDSDFNSLGSHVYFHGDFPGPGEESESKHILRTLRSIKQVCMVIKSAEERRLFVSIQSKGLALCHCLKFIPEVRN